jgi:hypothetical protein
MTGGAGQRHAHSTDNGKAILPDRAKRRLGNVRKGY